MATIKDVAKKAGLSVSTVSRFLNDHPYISEDKKERIRAAMKELDYTPSSIATQLRSKKSQTIGVLVSRITNPFFAYLVDAIEKVATNEGYHVLIMQTYDDSQAEKRCLEMLKQQLISGLIMCSVEGDIQLIESYQEFGPIVLCNEKVPNSSLPQIFTDQEQATFDGIKFLVEKGYQRIAYCTGGTLTLGGHGDARTLGFEKAILASQQKFNKNWIFNDVHTIKDGRKVLKNILKLSEKERPDAVFANSDEVASGIISEAVSLGIKVPEELGVMGFDNQPFTSMLSIPLTTIEQPVETLGTESTKYLLALLNNADYQVDDSQLKLRIIERKSV